MKIRIGIFLACIILLVFPKNAYGSERQIFKPYITYDIGSSPEVVAIGDVNGDGKNDVVITTLYKFDPINDYKLFVFIQNSAGGLNLPIKYSVSGQPSSVDICDLNNDGKKDVVVGNDRANIEVFTQNQSGGLNPSNIYNTTNSTSIKTGDFNNDGLLDVAAIGWGSGSVDILFQKSDGLLGTPITYPVQHGGYDQLEAGDVNNDGLTDLIVMSGQGYVNPNIGMMYQQPNGFSAPIYSSVGSNILTSGVAIGDINYDTLNDIVVSYGGNQPSSFIGSFNQNSQGTLNPVVSYAAYDCPESVRVEDVNSDGRKDIIVLNGGWYALSVYLQDSNGGMMPYSRYSLPYASHYSPQGLAVGDINSDGTMDVAIADYNNGLVLLYNSPSPVNLMGTSLYSNEVNLTWDNLAGATSYNVYRSNTQNGIYTKVGNPTSNSFTETGLQGSATYWYKVSGVNAYGESAQTEPVSVTVTRSPSPVNLMGTSLYSNEVNLTWDGLAGATSYNVYRSNTQNGIYTKVGNPTSNSFTETGLQGSATYWYKVSGVNAYGESEQTEPVSVTVTRSPSPVNLMGTSLYSNEVNLTWDDLVGAMSYNVYRSNTQNGIYTYVGNTTSNSFTETGLQGSTTYWYKVSGLNAYGESLQTEPVSVTVIAKGAPKGLTAQSKDKAIVLTWTTSSDADLAAYQLEYKISTSTASTWSIISSSLSKTTTTYTKTGLVNGTEYQFRIKAKYISGDWSPYSKSIASTPADSIAPAVPTGLKASGVNDKQVTIGWTSVYATDLAGYQIEYKGANDTNWTQITVGKVASYTIVGLTNEEEYTFRIKAKDTSSNLSGVSTEVKATPIDLLAPTIPTGLKAVIGTYNDVNLTWNANTEADLGGYEVSYLKLGTTGWVLKSIDAGVTSAIIDGLTPNVSYSFKIRAKDQLNNLSAYTSTVSAIPKDLIAPAEPQGLTLEPQDRSIVITWTANTEADLAGYQLEYKLSTASTWSIISSSLSKTTTTYTKTGLVNGTAYQFRIKAKDTSSNWSEYPLLTVTSTPADSIAPAVLTGLKVSGVNDKQVTLGWTAVYATDLAGYQIEYKGVNDTDWTQITVGKVVSYTIVGLTNGEEYTFRIKAKDTSSNLSGVSTEVKATPIDLLAPTIPTGLKAVIGTYNNVNLTWNANTEADLGGYEVYYLKSGTTGWVLKSIDAGVTSTTIDGLTPNVSYSFKIRAKDQLNNLSAYTSTVSAIPKDLIAPAAPQGLTLKPQDRSIVITWAANTETDLAGYQLEYKLSSASTWSIISSSLSKTTTTYTKTGLVNGTAYQFRIKAKDTSSNWSEYPLLTVTSTPADSIAPAVPTGLKVSGVNDKQVTIGWTAVYATDLAGYQVEYKGVNDTDWTQITVGKVVSYKVMGLTNGEEYTFHIKAKDTSSNLSGVSTEVKATPIDLLAPAIPTGLKAVIGTYNDVNLTWNANTEDDLGGYEVYYLKSGTTGWVLKSIDAGVTSTIIDGLTPNVSYSFKIRAKDQLNNLSAYTSTVSAIPKDLIAPAAPQGLTLEPQDRSIVITWTANTEVDLAGYQLEYKLSSASTWSIISSSLSKTTTTYTKTGLVNGTAYQFRIKAKDTSSNWSEYPLLTVTSTPADSIAPAVPTGLKVSGVNDKQVTIGWTAVYATDLAGYQIEYKGANDTNWTQITVGKVVAYKVIGLTNGEEYTFRIKAKDTSSNLSGVSIEVKATPASGIL